jgi:hypothetical protein
MSLYCQECGSGNLRRAHFRFSDVFGLLTLRYPVRCRSCKSRGHARIRQARLLPVAPTRRTGVEKAS